MSDCIFCKIVQGEITANVVYSDEEMVAFEDINPQAPIHVLIVPHKHIANNLAMGSEDAGMIGRVFLTANAIAHKVGVDTTGFRIVTNCGSHGGQTVDHIHFHLLGGRPMTWPPG